MRIIGNIEHPSLKISVFKNDGRTSVKFETSLYEQTFKLGDDERFSTLEGVQKLVDAPMLPTNAQHAIRCNDSAIPCHGSGSFRGDNLIKLITNP